MWKDVWGREHRYGPPAGWVPKDGTERFDAAEEWAGMVKRGLSFPENRGPSTFSAIRGECLEPLITMQHTVRLRPVALDEQLIDGAIYAIDAGPSENPVADAYRKKWGIAPRESLLILKFVRWICGQWHAQCKDSIGPLDEYGAVIGIVVAVSSLAGCAPGPTVHTRQTACGNPFDAESVECVQSSPNAYTQIVINNNNSAGSGITGITGLSNLGVVVSNPGPQYGCTVIVTATIQARQTVGTLGDVKLLVRYKDDGTTFVSSPQELKIVSASFQTYTMQWQFAHSGANAGVAGQASIWSDSGSTSDSYDWQQATLQMEYVLR